MYSHPAACAALLAADQRGCHTLGSHPAGGGLIDDSSTHAAAA